MQNMSTTVVRPSRDFSGAPFVHLRPTNERPVRLATQDEQFIDMLGAFRRTRGLARGHEVTSLLYTRAGLNVSTLARWMVDGEVVHFEWQHDSWFPMFQFSGQDLPIRLCVRQVLQEFDGVLDRWEIAQWFACPSATLGLRSPADEMALNPDLVIEAARSFRYAVDA